MKDFNLNVLDKIVDTKYNDYKGLVSIDTHDGSDLFSMCEDFGIDTNRFFVYGADCYDSEPVGGNPYGLRIKVLLIDKEKYGHSYDLISTYDGIVELIGQSICVPYDKISKYIKRISIGVVSDISGKINVQLPETLEW